MNETANRVSAHAQAVGCPPLVLFSGAPTPQHIEYLDLLPGPAKSSRGIVAPDAVAEFQGRAILYLVDGNGPNGTQERINELQTLLANRGEHACLGVTRLGSLDVYPINLDRQALQSAQFKTVLLKDEQAPVFFQSLATGTYELDGRPKEADYVYKTIHDLLTSASKALAGNAKAPGLMPGLEVLSTTGRALFFRFLIDRHIVLSSELSAICPEAEDLKDVFSTASKAAATSAWLDETFNGDLLPLVTGLPSDADPAARLQAYQEYYSAAEAKTQGKLFRHLEAILKGWKHVGGTTFQLPLIDWDDLDFAHIPIGVLSQVYESFSHQWDEGHAQETSVHYTPRNLARILVNEAFSGVDNPAEAVVLDPACGAGVFLVLAFRRLVQEYWKKHGARPDTKAIQRILYKQIRGFEVSESALRLAALALYITAIEVNGTQRPPRSLKFPRALRDEVLFDFGHDQSESRKGFALGSLGEHVPKHFDGTIDILVTNPPWTRLRADRKLKDSQKFVKEMNAAFTAISRRALRARGCDALAATYANPDNDPDLPFLWRATEWVRPGGLIAMALPARMIFKQDGNGKAARDAVLQSLAITGILNGSDLEQTQVWPEMHLPFMLLFARNSVPEPHYRFHFVTPVRENPLSTLGQFRIDYKSAETIGVRDVVDTPWLLKALAVGTSLDADVTLRFSRSTGTVRGYFSREKLESGKGYDLAPGSYSTKDLRGGIRDFEVPDSGFAMSRNLSWWHERHSQPTIHRTPDVSLYDPPLVIIPEAPRESLNQPKAFVSWDAPVAFSRSHYGYSTARSSDPELVASILYVAVHSRLFQHFCLMASSRQGASFRTILKQDVDRFPFPDPFSLSELVTNRTKSIAKAMSSGESPNWTELNSLVNQIYGLDQHDATVIEDTVTFCGPYRSVRERAEHPLQPQDLATFCEYLEDMLQPLFHLTRQRIHVSPIEQRGIPPWHFVTVSLNNEKPAGWKALLARVSEQANSTGASRVVIRMPKSGGLIVGILNQRRFWTRSRARLCSLHIEENHLDAFPIEAK